MKIFERSQIGKMDLRNRLAMAPMGTNGLTDIDCGYGRRLIDFYEARAKGGLGMVMTGAAYSLSRVCKSETCSRIFPILASLWPLKVTSFLSWSTTDHG